VDKTRINHAIDVICHRGCRYVNTLLADTTTRCKCRELQALDLEEQRRVLKELKSVMSVYDATGNCKV
jgi:hypothetical protein